VRSGRDFRVRLSTYPGLPLVLFFLDSFFAKQIDESSEYLTTDPMAWGVCRRAVECFAPLSSVGAAPRIRPSSELILRRSTARVGGRGLSLPL
jgi:hypothetical protein